MKKNNSAKDNDIKKKTNCTDKEFELTKTIVKDNKVLSESNYNNSSYYLNCSSNSNNEDEEQYNKEVNTLEVISDYVEKSSSKYYNKYPDSITDIHAGSNYTSTQNRGESYDPFFPSYPSRYDDSCSLDYDDVFRHDYFDQNIYNDRGF